LAFLLGVFIGDFVDTGFRGNHMLLMAAIALSIWLATKILKADHLFLALVALIISLFFIGLFRINSVYPANRAHDLSSFSDLGEKIAVTGSICVEPDIRTDKQYLIICSDHLVMNGGKVSVEGKMLVKTKKFPFFFYDEEIEVTGLLVSPQDFDTFSYSKFLGKDYIYTVMYNPLIKKVNDSGIDGWTVLYGLKHSLRQRIESLFPEPSAGLVLGLLLGIRTSIPDEILMAFQKTGLTHILAISGYNISLIINIFALLMRNSTRKGRFYTTVAGIVIFAILTGMSASVIRASIMGAITVFAMFLGRKCNGVHALFLSVFFMVMANPKILLHDISFQLSFMSTLGLFLLVPVMENFLKKLPPFIGEGLGVTLSATFFTLPITLLNFHAFSIISPLANIVFLPFIPAIMAFSFMAIAVSFFFYPLALLGVAFVWFFVTVLINGVMMMSSLQFAYVNVEWFGPLEMMIFYTVLFAVISFFRKPRSDKNHYLAV